MAEESLLLTLMNNLDETIGFRPEYFGVDRLITKEDIEILKTVLRKLKTSPYLLSVPRTYIVALNQVVVNFNSVVRRWRPNEYDNASSMDREARKEQFEQLYTNLLANAVTVNSLVLALLSVDESGSETRKRLDALDEYLDVKEEALKQKIYTVENQIEEFNGKNKDLGIVKYSDVFSKEFDRYRTSSNWWLASSIVLLIIIIGWLAYLGSAELSDETIAKLNSNGVITYYIIQKVVTRILIVSALFYGLAFSVKAFRANRHSSIVNKHRQSALETFEAFVNAPSADANTKNAVLLEATRTIFAHQTTGYDTNDKDAEVPNKIIEIIKPIGGN